MSTLFSMAQLGSQLTGLPDRFICAWWYAENGENFPATNNVGNISFSGEGIPSGGVFTGVIRVEPNRVVVYGTPEEGVHAWAELINAPVGEHGKIITIDTAMLKGKSVEEMASVVGHSNWAESHYDDGKGPGSLILDAYHNTVISGWYAGPSTPPAAPSTPVEPHPGLQTHVVTSGQTLSGIALDFRVPLGVLARFNGISDPNHIEVGQALSIPMEYRVKAGDTVSALAVHFKTTVDAIAHANQINPDAIMTGEQLWV